MFDWALHILLISKSHTRQINRIYVIILTQMNSDWLLLRIYWKTDALDDVTVHNFCFFASVYKSDGFHVILCLYSHRSLKTSKYGKNITDTLCYTSMRQFFVFTKFWHLLWSIIVQMYSKMESTSICEEAHTVVIPSSHNVFLKKLSYNVANVWCVNLGRKTWNICFHMPRCIPKRLN